MYKLQQNSVQRLSDGASIPFADGNRDYEEYKQWLADGGIPEPEFTETERLVNANKKLVQDSRAYLTSTDFYMTVDKYDMLTELRKTELITTRQEARDLINALTVVA